MIICVDTSGSMGGFNEECAKGFCLALMRISLADDRRYFISLFSTGQVDYELTADGGLPGAGHPSVSSASAFAAAPIWPPV